MIRFFREHRQSGSGIIQALVALGVISTVAVIVGLSVNQNLKLRKVIRGRDEFTKYNDILRNIMAWELGTILEGQTCNSGILQNLSPAGSDGRTFQTTPINDLGERAESFPQSLSSSALDTFIGRAYTGNKAHEDAKSLCGSGQTAQTNADLSAQQEFVFCILLRKGNATSYPYFATVRFKFKNLETQANLTCNTYKTTDVRGGVVYYTLYWTTNYGTTSGEQKFQQFSGSLAVSTDAV